MENRMKKYLSMLIFLFIGCTTSETNVNAPNDEDAGSVPPCISDIVECQPHQCGEIQDNCGNIFNCYCDSLKYDRECGSQGFDLNGEIVSMDKNVCGFGCFSLPLNSEDINCEDLIFPNSSHADNIYKWWCPDDKSGHVFSPNNYTSKSGTSCSSDGTITSHFGLLGNVFCCNNK